MNKIFRSIHFTKKQKKIFLRILISAFLLLILTVLQHAVPSFDRLPGWILLVLYLIPYFVIGHDILKKAAKGIWHLQPFDECFLMSLATVGALALGEFAEGVCVMLFYQVGELFQSYAVGKSRRSIADLMDIRPDTADLLTEDGNIKTVDPSEVAVGQTIVIAPGEKVPIDGIVLEGESSLDTSNLTGESRPRKVGPGKDILSGCINQTGLLKVQTTKEFGTSTASRILELVENAGMKKSRSENFITRFARIYTPAVVVSALFLAFLPPLIRLFSGMAPSFDLWIFRALTFLVISCPCALVVSIPLSFFGGIGAASRQGVLVKGSIYLELLSKTSIMGFDKTGTLTEGVFEVTKILPKTLSENELISVAFLAESHSSHPIALSIRQACKDRGLSFPDSDRLSQLHEQSGLGIQALVDDRPVLIGNLKLLLREGIAVPLAAQAYADDPVTTVYVAIDGVFAGLLIISDKIKSSSRQAMTELKKLGIRKRVLLSGDQEGSAKAIGRELNMDHVYAPLLPADKVDKVEALLKEKLSDDVLAFVGDGINDAPVLTRADIGIAMGGLGSDAAIEAADVVLMDDDPLSIPKAIRISRKCLRIVKENIWFALAVKLLCLILSALGLASMWLAIFADVGVMVLAVLNALRTLSIPSNSEIE